MWMRIAIVAAGAFAVVAGLDRLTAAVSGGEDQEPDGPTPEDDDGGGPDTAAEGDDQELAAIRARLDELLERRAGQMSDELQERVRQMLGATEDTAAATREANTELLARLRRIEQKIESATEDDANGAGAGPEEPDDGAESEDPEPED